jgi:hypothetical protein
MAVFALVASIQCSSTFAQFNATNSTRFGLIDSSTAVNLVQGSLVNVAGLRGVGGGATDTAQIFDLIGAVSSTRTFEADSAVSLVVNSNFANYPNFGNSTVASFEANDSTFTAFEANNALKSLDGSFSAIFAPFAAFFGN